MVVRRLGTGGRRVGLTLRLGVAGLCGVAWGCSGSDGPSRVTVYPVRGKVLDRGGQPLRGGHIYLVSSEGALTPEGPIGPDGTFSVATANSGEGAPVGDYKVRIEPSDARALVADPRVARGARRLPFPSKYLDEDRSGLRVRVEARTNSLEPIRLQ